MGTPDPRLEELSDQQLWTILDQWIAEVPNVSRIDVLADALMYRHAIARLAGRSECARLMTPIEHREAR